MPGGKGIPLEQWPTGDLVGVGILLATMGGTGVCVPLCWAWKAWQRGDTAVVVASLAMVVVYGFLALASVKFGQVLFRRWRSRRAPDDASSPEQAAAVEAKGKAKRNQP